MTVVTAFARALAVAALISPLPLSAAAEEKEERAEQRDEEIRLLNEDPMSDPFRIWSQSRDMPANFDSGAMIKQIGQGNSVSISQSGRSQMIGVVQETSPGGAPNRVEVRQSGTGQRTEILQRGAAHRSAIRQSGHGNSARSIQNGVGADARIRQHGAGLSAVVEQNGVNPQRVIVEQGPGAPAVTITHQGRR